MSVPAARFAAEPAVTLMSCLLPQSKKRLGKSQAASFGVKGLVKLNQADQAKAFIRI